MKERISEFSLLSQFQAINFAAGDESELIHQNGAQNKRIKAETNYRALGCRRLHLKMIKIIETLKFIIFFAVVTSCAVNAFNKPSTRHTLTHVLIDTHPLNFGHCECQSIRLCGIYNRIALVV